MNSVANGSIDFNGEMFPATNRAVVMAGISERQKDRIYELMVPMYGIKILKSLDSWVIVTDEETGKPVIKYENGKKRALSAVIDKGKLKEPFDCSNLAFKKIVKASSSLCRKIFRDTLYLASPKRDVGETSRKMANYVYYIEGDNITQFEALLCGAEGLGYSNSLIFVLPEISVLKEENDHAKRRYINSVLREKTINIINNIFTINRRKDLLQFFEEIWIVFPWCTAGNDTKHFIENLEIYKVKGSTDKEMSLEAVKPILLKQKEICEDDLRYVLANSVKIYGSSDISL